jgi:hypothetical protein
MTPAHHEVKANTEGGIGLGMSNWTDPWYFGDNLLAITCHSSAAVEGQSVLRSLEAREEDQRRSTQNHDGRESDHFCLLRGVERSG